MNRVDFYYFTKALKTCRYYRIKAEEIFFWGQAALLVNNQYASSSD
jgi:hypothetical protein